MPPVTSLSVLFLLLALCPLDVAGYKACSPNPCKNDGQCVYYWVSFGSHCICPSGYSGRNCEIGLPKDMHVMYVKDKVGTVSMMDLATKRVTDLFSTGLRISAMDYDPVNQKVYWCTWDTQCYVQDYDGSNPTLLFSAQNPVKDIYVVETSNFYFLDNDFNIWVKRDGQPPELVKTGIRALTVDKPNGRIFFLDADYRIRDAGENLSIQMYDNVGALSWNPSDSLLYVGKANVPKGEADIISIDVNSLEQKIILKDFKHIAPISAYRDFIVFDSYKDGNSFKYYSVSTNGTNLTYLFDDRDGGFVRPALFEATRLPGSVQGV